MSTPAKTPVKGSAGTDSPGTWRHPRLDEITRRRDKTTFSEKNVRRIAYNVVALLCMWTFQLFVQLKSIDGFTLPQRLREYTGWMWFAVQLVPCIQIVIACLPLLRSEDELPDIPLTAAQRQLLGLDPVAAVPTPDAVFSTPPRYSRTPSLAGSVGSRASYTGSPISNMDSPAYPSIGSQQSPSATPLFQSTMRRSSFSSSVSPFSVSTASSFFGDPSTPCPTGKRTSVGLNNKWLYEKGRRSSTSGFVH
ncbi:hypothetical protein ESCO_000412 [Escovopsis weberi]|uniref:Meiotically up-regulated protein n=1 Tax=Escovopsis weberi TaxID=150374 RepID=A0A0M9VTD2_ESCWE|nr:hypothetical protein ESCO_000412 [Escovopsis weberi]